MARDDDIEAILALVVTIGGWPVLELLAKQAQACEQVRRVNSNEAREAAEQAMLAASAKAQKALGTTEIHRSRILREIEGLPVGAPVDTRDYHKLIKAAVRDDTPSGRNRLRLTLAQIYVDSSAITGDELSNHLAAHMMQTAAGRYGLLLPEPMQGVDPATAEAMMLRRKVIADCGYTVGQEVAGNRVPLDYWKRAAKAYNKLAAKLKTNGEKVTAVAASTIRDWCTRSGEEHDLFESARAEGRRDRAAVKQAAHRMLPFKPAK